MPCPTWACCLCSRLAPSLPGWGSGTTSMVGSQAHLWLWGSHWSPGALPSPASVFSTQDVCGTAGADGMWWPPASP